MAPGNIHQIWFRKGWIIAIPLGLLVFALSGFDWLYIPLFYGNYFLGDFLSPDYDLIGMSSDEGDVLRTTKKLHIGFLGALWVAYWFLYAYFIGRHRSWKSHGWVIGTVGRMIWLNIPLFFAVWSMVNYAIANWNAPLWSEIGFRHFYMTEWLLPYLTTQFIAMNLSDGIHLVLDSSWAKGRLYKAKKTKRKRK